jgi:hypothetical protein
MENRISELNEDLPLFYSLLKVTNELQACHQNGPKELKALHRLDQGGLKLVRIIFPPGTCLTWKNRCLAGLFERFEDIFARCQHLVSGPSSYFTQDERHEWHRAHSNRQSR